MVMGNMASTARQSESVMSAVTDTEPSKVGETQHTR